MFKINQNLQKKLIFKKKKNKKTYRNLVAEAISIVNEAELFKYKDIGGININYNLMSDTGLNTQSMKAFSDLHFDDQENYLSTLEEITDLHKILELLIILAKAGNKLSTILYKNISQNLEGITNDISSKIKELINLINYYDLSEVFDSTLLIDSINKLPPSIIEESNSLIKKLKAKYEEIKIGDIKNYAQNLGNKVYNYIKQSHKLIKNIFDNLKELGNTLNSKNNKITEITSYYLNHTSSSFINTIQEAKNILENYFKNEYEYVISMVEDLLKEFEENKVLDLQKEKKIINNLHNKLENKNFTINFANDEDYKNIILNLYNSDKYITDIIDKIKQYIKEEIGIKDSGFFISNYDIDFNNKTFSSVIEEAKGVALKLDKDEYIDKKFDEIMTKFRESYTNIMEYLETKKFEYFPLDENTLETSLFKSSDKNKINTQITEFRVQISNKIKEENKYYMDNIKSYLSNFLNDNLEELNSIIIEIDILFSEESLNNLKTSFNNAINSCLNKITNDIRKNEDLAKSYFDTLYNIINSYNFNYNSIGITSGYLIKYNVFKSNFDNYKKYLSNQLYLEIVNKYKTVLTQIREILQIIKNIKITEKYPDFPEFEFYTNHIRIIDQLYNRLSIYFSDELFNNNYINLINNNKIENSKYIDSIIAYIDSKHSRINSLSLFSNDYYDYCTLYRRKVCYGCSNCDWYTYVYYPYNYYSIPNYSSNYNNLIKLDIYTDENLIEFQKDYNNFYSTISKK